MNKTTHQLLNDVNRAIIKFRGVYSTWSKKHDISYNEMLVLYTIRDNGYCTQKMICDSYLLPKQTINNVIGGMLKNGYLCDSPENSTGREKAYIFTDKGTAYAKPLLSSITIEGMGDFDSFHPLTNTYKIFTRTFDELPTVRAASDAGNTITIKQATADDPTALITVNNDSAKNVYRVIFTNEAGLGTAPLAFTEQKESSPEKAALLSMSAVFWDTVILCALTGIVIVSSLLRFPSLAENYTATTLTNAAFSLLPFGEPLLGISLIAFAYATLIGWSYFGAQAVHYLFGNNALTTYRLCYLGMIFLGSLLSLPLIWELTDFLNACMVLPNVFALFYLHRTIQPPKE